ncbi:MAG: outer membrane lipoprotein carrier protein LolA [Smithella sp.]
MEKFFIKINKLFTTRWIVLGLVLSIIAVPACGFSQDLPAIEKVVQRIQRSYEKTKDLKADFVQEISIKSIKKTDREEGKVFFKNPQNMLWDYTRPKGKKLVINRQTSWLYLSSQKVAYRQNSDSIFQSRILIDFFAGSGKLKDDFIIKYAESNALDKNGNYLLVLVPREKASAFNSVKLTIDKNKYYISGLVFDDALGNSTSLKFSNVSFNKGIKDSFFRFQPPAGVKIFDVP